MTSLKERQSLFLDTNALIYAQFSLSRQDQGALKLEYLKLGQGVIDTLRACREKRVRVFSTELTYLEMRHGFRSWVKQKHAFDFGFPLGLIFGIGRFPNEDLRKFLAEPLTPEMQQEMIEETEVWRNEWEFRDLIHYPLPEEIPNWFQIAAFIYQTFNPSVLDCLHLAAAIGLECDFLLTQDSGMRKTGDEMRKHKEFKDQLRDIYGISGDYNLPEMVKSNSLRKS